MQERPDVYHLNTPTKLGATLAFTPQSTVKKTYGRRNLDENNDLRVYSADKRDFLSSQSESDASLPFLTNPSAGITFSSASQKLEEVFVGESRASIKKQRISPPLSHSAVPLREEGDDTMQVAQPTDSPIANRMSVHSAPSNASSPQPESRFLSPMKHVELLTPKRNNPLPQSPSITHFFKPQMSPFPTLRPNNLLDANEKSLIESASENGEQALTAPQKTTHSSNCGSTRDGAASSLSHSLQSAVSNDKQGVCSEVETHSQSVDTEKTSDDPPVDASTSKPTKQKTQMYLELGQKYFDVIECSKCHMVYCPGLKSDLKKHGRFCSARVDEKKESLTSRSKGGMKASEDDILEGTVGSSGGREEQQPKGIVAAIKSPVASIPIPSHFLPEQKLALKDLLPFFMRHKLIHQYSIVSLSDPTIALPIATSLPPSNTSIGSRTDIPHQLHPSASKSNQLHSVNTSKTTKQSRLSFSASASSPVKPSLDAVPIPNREHASASLLLLLVCIPRTLTKDTTSYTHDPLTAKDRIKLDSRTHRSVRQALDALLCSQFGPNPTDTFVADHMRSGSNTHYTACLAIPLVPLQHSHANSTAFPSHTTPKTLYRLSIPFLQEKREDKPVPALSESLLPFEPPSYTVILGCAQFISGPIDAWPLVPRDNSNNSGSGGSNATDESPVSTSQMQHRHLSSLVAQHVLLKTEPPKPSILGVERLFVCPSMRRKSIAKNMVDAALVYALDNTSNDCTSVEWNVQKSLCRERGKGLHRIAAVRKWVAFSQPTDDGFLFAQAYTGLCQFWSY